MLIVAPTNQVQADACEPEMRSRFFWRLIGEDLLVVDLDRFEFTLLNSTAGLIWLELLSGPHNIEGLAARLCNTVGEGSQDLIQDILDIIHEWKKLGWLSNDDGYKLSIEPFTTAPMPRPYREIQSEKLTTATKACQLVWSRNMDFAGTAVRVKLFADPTCRDRDVLTRAQSFLAGIPDAAVTPVDAIETFVTKSGIFLSYNGICVLAEDVSDALSRLVLWCFYAAYGSDTFLGTFHAAAIGRETGAILMPGLSGVGKSTLTAYLSARGWLYGGDDIVGLAQNNVDGAHCLVLPFCSAISVKEASVPLLEPEYKGLRELPSITYDKKHARFPIVPAAWQMASDIGPREIKAIVFPHYAPGAAVDVTTLDLRETLLELVGIGYRTGEHMDPDLLKKVFNFFENTPTYKLTFSRLEEADDTLRALL